MSLWQAGLVITRSESRRRISKVCVANSSYFHSKTSRRMDSGGFVCYRKCSNHCQCTRVEHERTLYVKLTDDSQPLTRLIPNNSYTLAKSLSQTSSYSIDLSPSRVILKKATL